MRGIDGGVAWISPLPLVLDQTFNLGPCQEQDFGHFFSRPNGVIRVHSRGVPIHYVGAFDAPIHPQARQVRGRFPFVIGAGRANGHDLEYTTASFGRYYVVTRASGWNAGVWPYRVWVEYGGALPQRLRAGRPQESSRRGESVDSARPNGRPRHRDRAGPDYGGLGRAPLPQPACRNECEHLRLGS
jgi:hypothetical protein